jgi:hypothetical protein
MGKRSRDKGTRRERELVQAHREIGVEARRVPLSGACDGYPGDVVVEVPAVGRLVAESKARAAGDGFKTIDSWLGDNDLLLLVRDRAAPVVVLPWRTWSRILAALTSRDLVPPPFDTGAGI